MAFQELRLTSPHMKGPNVRRAQESLDHNRFGDFLDGKPDGVFGPITAAATKQAKYLLGYPKRKVDQHYDERLDAHLNNRHDISPLMKHRRGQRKQVTTGNVKVRALEIGLKEVGTKENPPNSNRVKYSAWYGITGPWCAMFFSWCEVQAGSKIFEQGHRWAYCPYIVAAAEHGDYGLRLTNDPEKGDAVLYQFDSDSAADHIGRFIEWTNASHTEFKALEGNTAPTNDANGGEVMVRVRARSLVQHFVRIPE